MIGPPGLPKFGRRVFRIAGKLPSPRLPLQPLKWAAAFYLAGVLAHFSHEMVFHLPEGVGRSLFAALSNAPVSLVWPADLIGTLLPLI
jgi:hypothetical protein